MAEYNRAAYGSHHKKQRESLMYLLVDGTECEYCARPMFRQADKNFDGRPLEADHEDADTSKPANRLIHSQCNRKIITKWVKHGPGWIEKYGLDPSVLNREGGTVTVWA